MERILWSHIAVLSLLVVSSTQMVGEFGYPCHPKWHVSLKQHYRNTGFDTRPGDIPMCDNHLKKGWYTFVDAAGATTEMATTCPGTNTCGTATPVWMNGSHPQVKDGIVARRVCGQVSDTNTSRGCCEFQDELFVKNCSGFYVYYLSPTSSCPVSYCAGTARRCPVGKWSNTSLEPCRDLAPVLTVPPIVKGPNVHANQTFDYQCQIQFGPNDPDQVFQVLWTFNNRSDPTIQPEILIGSQKVATLRGDRLKSHIDTDVGCQVITYYIPEQNKNTYNSQTSYFGVQSLNLTGPHVRGNQSFDFECHVATRTQDPNQNIEVVWTFDGAQDPGIQPEVITGGRPIATLDGSAVQGHLNTHIGCEARLIYEGYGIKSEFRKSNTYFAGIQVSPDRLEISDSEGEKTLTVTSTIPVVCDQARDCCVTYRAAVDKHSVVTLKDSCDFKLCLGDWNSDHKNASFHVTVVPSRNSISGGTREAVLSFEDIAVSGTGRYLGIFKANRPEPVQIVVRLEAGFKCSITGDPHFQGFDFKRVYDLYQTGDYTVYEVKDRDFQVQIRSWPCWAVTCVCGLVVREGNDVIKVHGCDKPGNLVSATVDVPYSLSAGTAIRRSSNGRHVGILLSSGSEIKMNIYSTYMNVYIQTPAFDKNKASGICGTNDGRPDNDFTHPDGSVTPVCSGPGRCLPVDFTESWRVDGPASMFVTSPPQVPEKTPEQYCSCPANSEDKSALSCSPRQHIQDSNLSCKNCKDITQYLQPSPWGQPDKTETPYIHKPVKAVDPSRQWPNDQGVTEKQAKDLCSRAIEKSQLYHQCKDVANMVDSAMAECLGDVLDGGTKDTLPAVTSSFTSKCQMAAASEDKNYQRRPDGGSTIHRQFSEDICPGECADHGRCAQNGTCLCQEGWLGETCQIEAEKGPQIAWSSGSPWCDVNQMSCQHFQFDKSNVDIHEKLKCRIQRMNKQGNKTGQPSIVDAGGVSSTRVVCSLPKTNLSSENYTISVTRDGSLYGNELPVYTFDSLCLSCNDSGCHVKNTGCHINHVCYRDGDTNRHNGQLVCDTTNNLTDWTPAAESARTLSRSATGETSRTSLAQSTDQTASREASHQKDHGGETSSSPPPGSFSHLSTSPAHGSGSHLSTTPAHSKTSDHTTIVSVPGQTRSTSTPLSLSHSMYRSPSTVATASSTLSGARSVDPAVRLLGSPISIRSTGPPITDSSTEPSTTSRSMVSSKPGRSMVSPTNDISTGSPTTDGFTDSPTVGRSMISPINGRSTGSPTADRSSGSFTTARSMISRAAARSMISRTADRTTGSPTVERSTAFLKSDRSMDSPTADRSMGSPTADRSTASPIADKSTSSLKSVRSTGSPTADRSTSSLKSVRSTGSPTADRSTASLKSDRSTGPLTAERSTASLTAVMEATTPVRAQGLTTAARSTYPTTRARFEGSATHASHMYTTHMQSVSPQATSPGSVSDSTTSRLSYHSTHAPGPGQTRLSDRTTPTPDPGSTTSVSIQTVLSTASYGTTTSGDPAETTSISTQRILQVLEQFIQQMKSLMDRLRQQ